MRLKVIRGRAPSSNDVTFYVVDLERGPRGKTFTPLDPSTDTTGYFVAGPFNSEVEANNAKADKEQELRHATPSDHDPS